MQEKVFVVGHKNPDTDSICSAIAYAALKNSISNSNTYVARRAGRLNEETQFVLNKCGVDSPEYLADVRTQVSDMEIRKVNGVDSNISLKKAWNLMKEMGVVTLPITHNKRLKGLITIKDIATSYMDVYDSKILSTAKTPYENIIETLDGTLITGNKNELFDKGKVLIAAANPDLMENYIEDGDLVILGNRYESQLCAIEMNAGCIIVCDGAPVSMTIKKLGEEHNCTIISSPHDTFTVARLINQSMPIKQFMRTENLITFNTDTFTDDIKSVMAKKRHRDFPVLHEKGDYMGMISRRNLLGLARKKIILVDHNEVAQSVNGISDSEIVEIIDHHRLGAMETVSPVFFRNQPLGCTSTIIYQIYKENNIKIPKNIAGLLCSAIISDTLMYRSPTCTPVDKASAESLAKIAGINVEEYATAMFRAGSNLTSKTDEEIFNQDFKKFSISDTTFGVGQISSMDSGELEEIKERLMPYMEKVYETSGMDMIFFMLTNMIETKTELLFFGSGAKELILDAFNDAKPGETFILDGLVSRKKQLIPELMMAIGQE